MSSRSESDDCLHPSSVDVQNVWKLAKGRLYYYPSVYFYIKMFIFNVCRETEQRYFKCETGMVHTLGEKIRRPSLVSSPCGLNPVIVM